MLRRAKLGCCVLLGLGALGGCAGAPDRKAESSPPADCDFAFYEAQEPTRPFEVIGEVPLTTNEWMSMDGRKALLARSVCEANADGVILGRPSERKLSGSRPLREYRARLLVFLDKPRTEAAPAPVEEPLPPGAVPVPVMLNGLTDDLTGTQKRTVDAAPAP